MPVRRSEATWNGTLKEGKGTMRLASGLYEGPYTYLSRFEEGAGTNPEELVAAAHAGCFSMFLSALLDEKGYRAERIHTTAAAHLGAGPAIRRIDLETEAVVPGIARRRVPGAGRSGQGELSRLQGFGGGSRDHHEGPSAWLTSDPRMTGPDTSGRLWTTSR